MQKIFRNVTFTDCIFLSDQIKEERDKKFLLFVATFEQLLNFLEQLLSNFLRNFGQRFGKSGATCEKPDSNRH